MTYTQNNLPPLPEYGSAISIKNLSFSYPSRNSFDTGGQPLILNDLSIDLPKGSRCLLLGSNGSGKSTLLRILGGRHLTKTDDMVRVCGMNAFRDTKLNFYRAYLDCDWGMRTVAFAGGGVPLQADVPVHGMMTKLQEQYPERRDEIVDMLGIDLNWRMHELSDGQRRRVQLLLGLIRPFEILLLDEITTSLDVCVRQDLLQWLKKETEERGATIVYATHIFDGLDDWPTDMMYLSDKGTCEWQGKLNELEYYQELKRNNHPAKMLAVADHWLRAELNERRKKRKLEKAAGSLVHEADPTLRQGGYASGRAIDMSNVGKQPTRTGRISDIRGNAGKMDMVSRTAGDNMEVS